MSKIIITLVLLASISTVALTQSIVVNYGCKSYAKDGSTCLVCSQRFYMDSSKICQPVSSSCRTFDSNTGACLTCYDGYFLAEVICVFGTAPGSSSAAYDPYCLRVVNQACTQCSRGFYLQNGTCNMVNPFCKTFDYTALACTACYPGYGLSTAGNCEVSAASSLPTGCSQFNNSICVRCSRGYYFDVNKNCAMADALCKGFDQSNGNCLSCYAGFKLNNGRCNVDNSTSLNPFCQTFLNETCTVCSRGYYFDANKICQQIDPLCKTFDQVATVCTSCYLGFSLVNGSCVVSTASDLSDPNCKTFDSKNVCLNCSKGYYFNQDNVCTQISPSCKTFNQNTLQCTACYSGYDLVQGNCIISNSSSSVSSTCAEWLDSVCVKCVPRAYYDFQANCVLVSDSCKTFNSFNGKCTSCYPGYSLDASGACVQSSSTNLCASTDPNTGLCTRCFNGSYLDASSTCVAIDAFCQTFNFQSRQCESCYKGYSLNKDRTCQVVVLPAALIQNCVEYDLNQNCTKCFNFYYLSKNECVAVNPLCKTYDPVNGNCLSCYSFFTLNNGVCALS